MNLRQLWSGSTLLRVSTVLGAVTLLAVAVVLTAAVSTERSTGKGAAINIAGSLRMQSYLLATRVAGVTDPRADRALLAAQIDDEIAAFESRLANPRLTDAVPPGADSVLRGAYLQIAEKWLDLKPLARAAAQDAAARDVFLQRVHPFVADVDRLVVMLEADLESRIHGLQVALGAALFVILVLVLTAIFVLDIQVFQPIKDLARAARAVRAGDFSVRTDGEGEDELGQLGRDFNHMVEELGRLYGSLEAQIAAKTADLEQKNQSLSLLYETTRELSSQHLEAAALERVASHVRRVLGVDGVVICARQPAARDGLPLARAEARPGEICEQVGCAGCLDEARVIWHAPDSAADGARPVVSMPLLDGERLFGVMALQMMPQQSLAPWRVELAQTIGRHVGAALAAAEARDEHRRLALFEERSAIARELHDSLAQSLSYTKIQLARLGLLLREPATGAAGADMAGAREVVQDLREGVSSAYRQLRELLTTFRLQLSGKGLGPALAEAVADFRSRTQIETELRDDLIGIELSANQQIHVLQIVREALANVEHHARARRAWVQLTRVDGGGSPQVEVAVEDDGIGIPSLASPRQHFGLLIMRDRAQMVGGTLDIGRRPQGGTAVRLRFRLDSPFGALARAVAAAPTDAEAAPQRDAATEILP
jgi:two-component system, NarL family, nitrate/nitrite sensor histidine kinase NarX